VAVPAYLAEIWAAFWRLAADRPVYIATVPLGSGEVSTEILHGPIPFLAVDAYARRFGHQGEAFQDFHALISAMDQEWLMVAAEKRAERGG
jgi:hypothetical protein